MKERPIIFNGDMVRAILDGRKTQTRRMVKPQPYPPAHIRRMEAHELDSGRFGFFDDEQEYPCPYGQPGDRLWVREAWNLFAFSSDGDMCWPVDKIPPADPRDDPTRLHFELHYAATTAEGPWRPPIHMPRWASRITLEVTGARVERVQEIGRDGRKAKEVLAEGVSVQQIETWKKWLHHDDAPAQAFGVLWDSINGLGSWKANPWVWVVEFSVIDTPPKEGA